MKATLHLSSREIDLLCELLGAATATQMVGRHRLTAAQLTQSRRWEEQYRALRVKIREQQDAQRPPVSENER